MDDQIAISISTAWAEHAYLLLFLSLETNQLWMHSEVQQERQIKSWVSKQSWKLSANVESGYITSNSALAKSLTQSSVFHQMRETERGSMWRNVYCLKRGKVIKGERKRRNGVSIKLITIIKRGIKLELIKCN